MGTPEFAKSRNERKKVEMRFAHLKTHLGAPRKIGLDTDRALLKGERP
jgi:hypothetical protein